MSQELVTNTGVELIERWKKSNSTVARHKAELNRAECEARNATSALAKWLMPDDAQEGEKFSVWHGSELIEVSVPFEVGSMNREPTVKIRTKTKRK